MSILIIQGAIIGLVLSVLAGPIFFIYIQVASEKGFRAALAVGIGAWLSDLLFIILVTLGVGSFISLIEWDGFKFWFALFGGIMLISFGISTIYIANRKKLKIKNKIPVTNNKNYINLFLKGFSINSFNPFVALFWLGTMGILTALIDNKIPDTTQKFNFFGSIYIVVVVTDIIKMYLSKKIKHILKSPSAIYNLQKVIGIVLILLGIILIIRGSLN